jgi:hypothetical protein
MTMRIRHDKSVYNPKYNERRKLKYRQARALAKIIAEHGTFTTAPPPPPPPPTIPARNPREKSYLLVEKYIKQSGLQRASVEKFTKFLALICAGGLTIVPSSSRGVLSEESLWDIQIQALFNQALERQG